MQLYDYYHKFKPIVVTEDVFDKYKDNNGVELHGDFVDRLIATTPSNAQLQYLEMRFYAFVHFGVNTFTNREWGTGKESPSEFNPSALDTDQWCRAMISAGMKGVILTAKHHDGFCLWQTETTEHSIKNSPYKGGRGDVVGELAKSCAKYGLKLGLYLSPWDRNSEYYGHNTYNDFYIRQVEELTTKYGELFSLWFDGARGDCNMDEDFAYDFPAIYATIRKNQPNAVLSICAPDVRWVGNEGGRARECEWSVVGAFNTDNDKIAAGSQHSELEAKKMAVKATDDDLGSRKVLSEFDAYAFYPAETDVSMHFGWFYHPMQRPRKHKHLLKIYYTSTGANSSLLLNIPVDRRGLVARRDERALQAMGRSIAQFRSKPCKYTASVANEIVKELSSDDYSSYKMSEGERFIDFKLDKEELIGGFEIREDVRYSERVELFDLFAKCGDNWVQIASSSNIGNSRILVFRPKTAVKTDCVRLAIKQSRDNPVIRSVAIYAL